MKKKTAPQPRGSSPPLMTGEIIGAIDLDNNKAITVSVTEGNIALKMTYGIFHAEPWVTKPQAQQIIDLLTRAMARLP